MTGVFIHPFSHLGGKKVWIPAPECSTIIHRRRNFHMGMTDAQFKAFLSGLVEDLKEVEELKNESQQAETDKDMIKLKKIISRLEENLKL